MWLYLHVQSSDCLSWPATEQKHPNLHGVSCGCDWLACTKHGIFTVFCHSDCTRELYYSRMSCVSVRWICHIFSEATTANTKKSHLGPWCGWHVGCAWTCALCQCSPEKNLDVQKNMSVFFQPLDKVEGWHPSRVLRRRHLRNSLGECRGGSIEIWPTRENFKNWSFNRHHYSIVLYGPYGFVWNRLPQNLISHQNCYWGSIPHFQTHFGVSWYLAFPKIKG